MKKSLFKKVISIFVSSALIVSLTAAVSASESPPPLMNEKDLIVLADNEREYVVQETTEDGVVISTKNYASNMLTIEFYDNNQTLQSVETLDLNALAAQIDAEMNNGEISTFSAGYQRTISNREYEYRWLTQNGMGYWYWNLRAGPSGSWSKGVNENSINSGSIENFRRSVEDINSAEGRVVATAGVTVVGTIIAALATGGFGAAAAAVAGTGVTASEIATLNNAINNADYYYGRC